MMILMILIKDFTLQLTFLSRYLTATENLFQYRPLGSYYPEYHTGTAYNGFIDVSLPTYETHQLASKT